ncbi:MAG: Zn-dependent hydrolase [Bacteroidia bacterium]|nr:Zn-dependent hydrolase [Bacteroidia bacterium]
MIRNIFIITILSSFVILINSCGTGENDQNQQQVTDTVQAKKLTVNERINEYAVIPLVSDLSKLTDKDKEMLTILISACKIMDEIFWMQSYGIKDSLFAGLKNPEEAKLCDINYGPWDRLNGNEPFLENVNKKPIGAGFYPSDIKYLPFIDMKFEDKISMYTVVKRSEDGSLYTQPYHVAYKDKLEKAADLLKKAAKISENKDFAKFLNLRAEALLNDDYYPSEMFWMDMESNNIDLIIGPIESEEDRFINTKTAYEAFLLIKDLEWSNKLKNYSSMVPEIKNQLPLDDNYKNQIIFTKTNIGVYDAIFYGGYANAGAKNISINHPKDGRILMEKGSKKMQFKNAMKAKFDKILQPISNILISDNERKNVKFDAFFINNVNYEIADAIVVKTTINNKGPVKDALKDYYPTINSLKADILNLYIITKLHEKGVIKEVELLDNYVIFMTNVIRSVRFGATYSQGSSNIICFNVLQEMQAFTRDEKTGTYSVNFDKMKSSIESFSSDIMKILAEGNYDAAKELIESKGNMQPTLQEDLKRISSAGIPTDITFEQGEQVLGLTK